MKIGSYGFQITNEKTEQMLIEWYVTEPDMLSGIAMVSMHVYIIGQRFLSC